MLFIRGISLFTISFCISSIQAFQNCPIHGPDFPPPQKLPTNHAIQSAIANVSAVIGAALNTSILSPNTSFSVQVFSTHNSDALFQYHYTASGPSVGVKKVDSHSIYRIGSISKVFAVLAFLIEAGDIHFNEPVTKYVPELRNASRLCHAAKDPVACVDWKSVTIGNLASQLGGIGRDYAFEEIILTAPPGTDFTPEGFPPLNSSDIPPCGSSLLCTRAQFFAGFIKQHPTYAPSTTPTYSNVAFQILSYALEFIARKSFEEIFDEKIVKKLGLTDTSYSSANTSRGVVPGSEGTSGWSFPLGDEGPAGGIYSSSADISTVGRAILSSKLLLPSQTRRWLKPVSFTADLNAAVGAPWEIFRLQLSPPSRVVDLYTKNGGIGSYATELVLVPDWDVGFIVLTADAPQQPSTTLELLTDLLVSNFLPAVEVAAREESNEIFAGHYVSLTPGLNSSLTITTDPKQLGLGLTSWISNGSDALAVYGALGAGTLTPDVRLYPTNLQTVTANGDIEISWRAAADNPAAVKGTGLLAGACFAWTSVGALTYGGVAVDDFVFTVAKNGTAVSIEPRVVRAVLRKV